MYVSKYNVCMYVWVWSGVQVFLLVGQWKAKWHVENIWIGQLCLQMVRNDVDVCFINGERGDSI